MHVYAPSPPSVHLCFSPPPLSYDSDGSYDNKYEDSNADDIYDNDSASCQEHLQSNDGDNDSYNDEDCGIYNDDDDENYYCYENRNRHDTSKDDDLVIKMIETITMKIIMILILVRKSGGKKIRMITITIRERKEIKPK